ncbi:MAG: peroxiredoxin [Myxococcaceae bacterium]|jgi:peroxiredoxin Q/BCP|nr:peroxiredoxin [Myxococcaceae bacterium]MCA3012236.1 peroxiredoxin [Myxococcaceae bacterium]
MLQAGDLAPDFDAADCRGERVVLSSFRGQRRVVLFFFPKAFSPACTLEVRHFRDHYERIRALGAELIGVSVDKAERQCRFALDEGLQFRLVGDESRVISERYGVLWPVLRVDRRATFIVGLTGLVEDVFHHEVQVHRHLDDVLARLEQLARG